LRSHFSQPLNCGCATRPPNRKRFHLRKRRSAECRFPVKAPVKREEPRRSDPAGFVLLLVSPRRRGGVGLFQRAVDAAEVGVQGRAEAIDRRDDRQRNPGRNQTIFNRGRPRLIGQKLQKNALQRRLRFREMRAGPGAIRKFTAGALKLCKEVHTQF